MHFFTYSHVKPFRLVIQKLSSPLALLQRMMVGLVSEIEFQCTYKKFFANNSFSKLVKCRVIYRGLYRT